MTALSYLIAFFALISLGLVLRTALRLDFGHKALPLGLALLCGLGAAVSLHHFDAIGAHAVEAHEESLVFAYQGIPQPDILHPLEVHPLLLSLYTQLGRLVGPDMTGFVLLALLLGGLGALFAGLALGIQTRSAWPGLALGLLLALHPDLAYWRVQGFHVALPHAAFCGSLLAAVVVARAPSRPAFTAWFILGAFVLSIRLEMAGAVAATALLPALTNPKLLGRVREWSPGFLLALAALAPTLWLHLRAVTSREDYWTGAHFAFIHLSIPELFFPLSFPPLILLAGLIIPLSFVEDGDRRSLLAWLLPIPLSLLPALSFAGFGPRHGLAATTLALCLLILCVHRLYTGRGGRLALSISSLLLAWTLPLSWSVLDDMGERYRIDLEYIPSLPNTERPKEPLSSNVGVCRLYAGAPELCDRSPSCLPPKDLRDPYRVAARLEASPGSCVVWAIDDREDDVRGVRHEYWRVLRGLYRWEPLGWEEFDLEGGLIRRADYYRLDPSSLPTPR